MEHQQESELHPDFGLFVGELIRAMHNTKSDAEAIEKSFAYFNELAVPEDERIDNLLGTSVFIDLWDEFCDNEEIITGRLKGRALELYRENIRLWTDDK